MVCVASVSPYLFVKEDFEGMHELIKRQSCHHIETSQLTGFCMMAILALNELLVKLLFVYGCFLYLVCACDPYNER